MNISSEVYEFPYSCYINLTSKCNLRCRHCFGNYSKELENELTLEEWKLIIDDLIKCNVFYIIISGGEATQSPFFKDFINYLEEKGVYFILTTNGVFSKEIRDFILKKRDYLINVKVSLDGPDAFSHGFIRRDLTGNYNPFIFEKTLDNIFYLKEKNIPLSIVTVLHKENIRKINELKKLIRKIKPLNWFISPIIPVGRGEKNKFISEFYEYFDSSFWNSLSQENKEIKVKLVDSPIELKEEGLSVYSCAAAINFCEIHSDGKVSPCTLSRVIIPESFMKFENIKDKSLKEIWDGKIFNKFRSYMDKGCEGCKMISKCNKCIAQSFRYFGRGDSPTPFCIKNGDKLGLKNLEEYKIVLEKEFKIKLK